MAMYQIPQFLDSGDKIFFAFNFIQLIFFIIGFFLSLITYYLISYLFPNIGIYAIVPAVPFFFSFLYLAAGKFNGRDTYLYIGKFIKLFLTSPKLTYAHVADLSDLYEKFGSLDYENKAKELEARYTDANEAKAKSYLTGTTDSKTQFIKDLGSNLDANYINTSALIAEKDAQLAQRQKLLDDIMNKNKTSK
jgi:hypothetical protein